MFVLPDAGKTDLKHLEKCEELNFSIPPFSTYCYEQLTTSNGYTFYSKCLRPSYGARVFQTHSDDFETFRVDKNLVIPISISYKSFTCEAEKTHEEANVEVDDIANSENVSIDEASAEAEKLVVSDEFVIVEKNHNRAEKTENLMKEPEIKHQQEVTNDRYQLKSETPLLEVLTIQEKIEKARTSEANSLESTKSDFEETGSGSDELSTDSRDTSDEARNQDACLMHSELNYFSVHDKNKPNLKNYNKGIQLLNEYVNIDNFYNVIWIADLFGLNLLKELVFKNFIIKENFKTLTESSQWQELEKNQPLHKEVLEMIFSHDLNMIFNESYNII